MKIILLTLLTICLIACEKKTTDISDKYTLPEELSGCKIYRLKGSNGGKMTVVHCPNSTTTTTHSCGKSCSVSNTLISGGM